MLFIKTPPPKTPYVGGALGTSSLAPPTFMSFLYAPDLLKSNRFQDLNLAVYFNKQPDNRNPRVTYSQNTKTFPLTFLWFVLDFCNSFCIINHDYKMLSKHCDKTEYALFNMINYNKNAFLNCNLPC